jgi:hypothetical protein
MQVTKNITLDLLETGSPVIIKAKQNDRNTRYIAAHLYVGRLDYQVPSGTEIAFRYKKPDGTAGFYDALPDNSPAITVSGNTVTVELVEQVLTVAGCVHCEINMYNAASEKLTTFTFEISVEESVLTDTEIISSDYYNVLTAEIAKALQAVTDATEQAENAAQSAQDAADSAAMSKDWAAGQPVTYSGTPVSIAYAGANRIASITAYGETPQGGTTEAPVALTGISSITVNDDVTELPIPRPLRRVGDVRDVCVTRQEYEGTEKLVVTYNVGFVELDGTEASHIFEGMFYLDYSASWPTPANRVNGVCSHYPYGAYGKGKIGLTNNGAAVVYNPNGDYTGDEGGLANWKAYLAAQKEAGTPVQVAYQRATPETYATDPLDIDNAAGPLTVMTGGEVEVRMTELVGSRSPELVGKMDNDIYFQVGNLNLGDNTNLLNPVNQQGQASYTGDSTSPYCIDRWRISNGTTYDIASRALTASSYANRACGMWQTNELAQQALAIGSTITFSGYINGMQHSGTIKILNRDLYSSFAEVPAGYECDDFEIVCCTASHEQSKYNLGIYPKKEAVLNWIKWEKGLYATPYAPKGFGLEQLECMRYYQTIKGIKYVLRKALASEGFPYVIPVTFMPMRAVPQTDITVTEGAENNLTATGVTQTACGIQFQPVAENVGLTFTLTLSANL